MKSLMSSHKSPFIFHFATWSDGERQAFKEGSVTMIKGAGVAVMTWGLVTGIAMAKSGLLLSQVLGMSLFVYAGSAQLASIPLILENLPFWSIWLTASIVNLRFVIFSAAFREHFRGVSKLEKAWIGFFNPDISFALYIQKYPEPSKDPLRIPFFWGLAFFNWFLWQLASIIGIFVAIQIPDSWNISFAGILALIVITMPMIDHGFARFAAVAAAIVSVLTISLPYKLNIVCAVIAAIVVGMGLDRYQKQSQKAIEKPERLDQ
jgi:predicted branched-subunit amino acid permease